MQISCGGGGAGAGGGAGGIAGGAAGGAAGGGIAAGGGAAACGGACGGYDETTVLSYCGNGGDWSAETTYKYVGKGAGEFEMVTVPTNIKQGWCYCVVAVGLVGVVLYLLTSSPTTTTTRIIIPTTTPQDIPTTTSEPYCCKSKGLWSLDKKLVLPALWCRLPHDAEAGSTANSG